MKAALAICGQIGSGKSTASNFLASEFGFRLVSFGDFVRHQLTKDDCPVSRGSMQDAGHTLYKSLGASGMVHGALAHFGICADSTVVFDGVRHIEVLTAIRSEADATFTVYLEASRNERFRRCRERQGLNLRIEDFDRIDGHPVEAGIPELARHCDLVIDTEVTLSGMQERLLREIRRWNR